MILGIAWYWWALAINTLVAIGYWIHDRYLINQLTIHKRFPWYWELLIYNLWPIGVACSIWNWLVVKFR